jgi:SAM-dependent methyltransferase
LLSPFEYRNKALEARYSIELRRLGLARPTSEDRLAQHPKGSREALDRYGELRHLREWGFMSGSEALSSATGGLWEDTRKQFDDALPDSVEGKTCVDLGCGNGRFIAAALKRGADKVIGVETGWDVEPLQERFTEDDRVHVVQARFDQLPIVGTDVIYAIGSISFAPDPEHVFRLAAGACRSGGLIAIDCRARLSTAGELRDRLLRGVSTRLTRGGQVRFAQWLAGRLGPASLKDSLDWWSAPFARALSAEDLASWAESAQCETLHCEVDGDRVLGVFRREPASLVETKPLRIQNAA